MSIAYTTAWIVALGGTALGLMAIAAGLDNGFGIPNEVQIVTGVVFIAGAWLSASAVGILAEISRKLTFRSVG